MSCPSVAALETISWIQSIEHVVAQGRRTYLVVCCARSDLLHTLEKELSTESSELSTDHSILHPTIARLKALRDIRLVFAPSLTHLRAVLSTIPSISKDIEFLSIIGLPDLHLSANQLNAQSVSRTLALTIDGVMSSLSNVTFLCPRKMMDHWDEDMVQSRESIWERKLPVLASSTRTGEDRTWSGRTVMMGDVFGQWCRVVRAST